MQKRHFESKAGEKWRMMMRAVIVLDKAQIEALKVGNKILLFGEKRPYTVRCRDDRFIVCTKPYNPKRTVWYTIIDMQKMAVGPDDRVFCAGYETDEQCADRLKELQLGLSEVSRRRSVPFEWSE